MVTELERLQCAIGVVGGPGGEAADPGRLPQRVRGMAHRDAVRVGGGGQVPQAGVAMAEGHAFQAGLLAGQQAELVVLVGPVDAIAGVGPGEGAIGLVAVGDAVGAAGIGDRLQPVQGVKVRVVRSASGGLLVQLQQVWACACPLFRTIPPSPELSRAP